MLKRVTMACVVALTATTAAWAQSSTTGTAPGQTATTTQPPASAQAAQQPDVTTMPVETRRATTTYLGDTGLWFVPTGEILPAGRWSVSAYRVNFDYNQGFTDVSDWPITIGVGLGDRAELFTAATIIRRIDRDVRPLFSADPKSGGLVNEYPFVSDAWSGSQFGDIWLGAKINLTSQWRQQPSALALRGMLKIPTAKDDEEGVGTGKMDIAIDAIFSKEVNERVEFSGFGGVVFRGDPDDVDLANGFRWGVGAGFPSRKNLRVTAELFGEAYFDDSLALTRTLTAVDGTVAPADTNLDSPFNAALGLTWLGRNMFAGVGLVYRVRMDGRAEFGDYSDESGDSLGFQLRLGYHPGVRIYVAPPPPPAPAPPPPTPTHDLSVKARCEPCTVEVGKVATVTADAVDSIGCSVTYSWNAPTGTFGDRTMRQTPWTAPMQEGTVPVTITVTCPQDNKTATDTVNIQVIRPAIKEIIFEDVHFDFDRYSLRPEATRALDEAISALQQQPELRLEIEGHTCNIGTAEYNLALGERRAHAVRDYLTGRGISTDRLRTVSYGEERPKHDNAREETRRLNRRAALVVRVQR
jgi:outer membrane protein OmpA-like peptidoglycan-associated protein